MAEDEVTRDKWGVPIPQSYLKSVSYRMAQKAKEIPRISVTTGKYLDPEQQPAAVNAANVHMLPWDRQANPGEAAVILAAETLGLDSKALLRSKELMDRVNAVDPTDAQGMAQAITDGIVANEQVNQIAKDRSAPKINPAQGSSAMPAPAPSTHKQRMQANARRMADGTAVSTSSGTRRIV